MIKKVESRFMRHNKIKRSSFGLKPGPRQALIRNLIFSLVEHERIKTTLPRAKCVRRYIEKAMTLGKLKNVSSRRILLSRFPHPEVVSKIVNQLADRFKDRSGGYTRIIKLGPRHGDRAETAYLEFVDYSLKSGEKTDEKTKAVDKKTAAVKKRLFLSEKKRKKHIRKMKKTSRRKNRTV